MKYLFFIRFHSSKINKTKNLNTQQMQQKYKTDSQKKTYIKLQFTLCLPSTQKFMIELNWVCCIKNFKARRRRRTHTLFLVCCVIFFFFVCYLHRVREAKPCSVYSSTNITPLLHQQNQCYYTAKATETAKQSKATNWQCRAHFVFFHFISFLIWFVFVLGALFGFNSFNIV